MFRQMPGMFYKVDFEISFTLADKKKENHNHNKANYTFRIYGASEQKTYEVTTEKDLQNVK